MSDVYEHAVGLAVANMTETLPSLSMSSLKSRLSSMETKLKLESSLSSEM